ncbi:unnamed protein product [Caenorhabditis brenneri]
MLANLVKEHVEQFNGMKSPSLIVRIIIADAISHFRDVSSFVKHFVAGEYIDEIMNAIFAKLNEYNVVRNVDQEDVVRLAVELGVLTSTVEDRYIKLFDQKSEAEFHEEKYYEMDATNFELPVVQKNRMVEKAAKVIQGFPTEWDESLHKSGRALVLDQLFKDIKNLDYDGPFGLDQGKILEPYMGIHARSIVSKYIAFREEDDGTTRKVPWKERIFKALVDVLTKSFENNGLRLKLPMENPAEDPGISNNAINKIINEVIEFVEQNPPHLNELNMRDFRNAVFKLMFQEMIDRGLLGVLTHAQAKKLVPYFGETRHVISTKFRRLRLTQLDHFGKYIDPETNVLKTRIIDDVTRVLSKLGLEYNQIKILRVRAKIIKYLYMTMVENSLGANFDDNQIAKLAKCLDYKPEGLRDHLTGMINKEIELAPRSKMPLDEISPKFKEEIGKIFKSLQDYENIVASVRQKEWESGDEQSEAKKEDITNLLRVREMRKRTSPASESMKSSASTSQLNAYSQSVKRLCYGFQGYYPKKATPLETTKPSQASISTAPKTSRATRKRNIIKREKLSNAEMDAIYPNWRARLGKFEQKEMKMHVQKVSQENAQKTKQSKVARDSIIENYNEEMNMFGVETLSTSSAEIFIRTISYQRFREIMRNNNSREERALQSFVNSVPADLTAFLKYGIPKYANVISPIEGVWMDGDRISYKINLDLLEDIVEATVVDVEKNDQSEETENSTPIPASLMQFSIYNLLRKTNSPVDDGIRKPKSFRIDDILRG